MYEHGLLFSRKQRGSFVSNAAYLLCSVRQRCPAMYTHVALLYDGNVYETSLTWGVEVTSFDHAVNEYTTFMPLNELNDVDNMRYAAALDTLTLQSALLCTEFVQNALALANVNVSFATPDQLYAALTL